MHRRSFVVLGQQPVGFVEIAAECLGERAHDPQWVVAGHGEIAEPIDGRVRRDGVEPIVEVARTDLPHDRVGEPGGTGAGRRADEVDRRRDRGVRRDPREQQLIDPEPHRVEGGRVDAVQIPVGGDRDDRVDRFAGA